MDTDFVKGDANVFLYANIEQRSNLNVKIDLYHKQL